MQDARYIGGRWFICRGCGKHTEAGSVPEARRRKFCSWECRYAEVRSRQGPNQNGGLCECGCGEPAPIAKATHKGFGHVEGQPLRYVKGHGSRARRSKWIEEDRGYETPCWIWQLTLSHEGYGKAWRAGRVEPAHRWVYVEEGGVIPEGHDLHHRCGVRACVNPAHLEAITRADHSRHHIATRSRSSGRFT